MPAFSCSSPTANRHVFNRAPKTDGSINTHRILRKTDFAVPQRNPAVKQYPHEHTTPQKLCEGRGNETFGFAGQVERKCVDRRRGRENFRA